MNTYFFDGPERCAGVRKLATHFASLLNRRFRINITQEIDDERKMDRMQVGRDDGVV